MNINDIIELGRIAHENDPRPIDTQPLAELLFNHLMYGGFIRESDREYIERTFNAYLSRAVQSDREGRMIQDALNT